VSFVAWHRPLRDRPRRYLLVSVGTIFRTDKYDTIRGKSKQNTGGNNNNNGNQGGRNNNYSGPNRKRKPDNTVTAIQRPMKDNSKKTSGGLRDLLKEKCP
jgi:hypothetical protein